MADKTTTLKTKTNDNVYPNIIGDNMDNAISDSPQIKHTLTAEHKINFRLDNNVNNLINNSLQKPAGLTKTKLVGVGTNGQENIEIGDNLTLANGKLSATGGSSGGEGGISVIELTDKNGTIASTQLSEINANPQNFAFKYNGKILLFTSADSTTYQYCNNTTSSSDNNVMTTSTLLTITSSTGVYTIAEKVHNVVANSIHPANGGDLTNIQVGSKVYSIPSGGGGNFKQLYVHAIRIKLNGANIYVQLTLDNNEPIDNLQKLKNALRIYLEGTSDQSVPCSGYTKDNEAIVGLYYWNEYILAYIALKYNNTLNKIERDIIKLSDSWVITDNITIPQQAA